MHSQELKPYPSQKACAVIDFEASGISCESYPIEVGIAFSNGRSYEALIKPDCEWIQWDYKAQSVHGISRSQLQREGSDIQEVCHDLNALCKDLDLYSDYWVYDSFWLKRLFRAANLIPAFTCQPIERILSDTQLDNYQKEKKRMGRVLGLPAHRALSDATVIQSALETLLQSEDSSLPLANRPFPLRAAGLSA